MHAAGHPSWHGRAGWLLGADVRQVQAVRQVRARVTRRHGIREQRLVSAPSSPRAHRSKDGAGVARQQPHLGELTLPARLGDSTNVRWHDASTPSHRKRPNCCKLWRSPQTAHDSTPIFRSFLPPPSAGLPASYNGTPMSQTLGTGPPWATTAQNATFPSVQNDLRASTRPARRWRQVCATKQT